MHQVAPNVERRRNPAFRDAVQGLRQPFRPNYPAGHYLVTPMPATRHEIQGLRAILRYARAKPAPNEQERMLADGLARALAYLEEPDERVNVMRWILGALHQSMRRAPSSSNLWVTADRDLHDWAMRQIEDLLGPFPTENTERITVTGDDPGPIYNRRKDPNP